MRIFFKAVIVGESGAPVRVKNVPGRRTDVSDCQWLQYLHTVGLLRASFRPARDICAVRSLLRHRASLVDLATCHVQHMQKALDQMNLHVHHVIPGFEPATKPLRKARSEITGKSICSRCDNPLPCIASISDGSPPVRKKCSG